MFFLTRHPCRIVTTSVDGAQLQGVLWGEIRRFIQTSRIPLDSERGGPLVINHMYIRKLFRGEVDGLSYLMGRVANAAEGMSGHHIAKTGDGIPRTLFLGDEASGIAQVTFEKADEWANRMLIIGNPYECASMFKWAVKGQPGSNIRGGDIPRDGGGYHRKVIRIKAEDSPNVRYAQAQIKAGLKPTGEILIPGVLPWEDYVNRRATWDAVKQCAGLDADFYEGAETLMFPPEWLNRAETIAERLPANRRATGIGVDPGEGGDDTAMCAVDALGVIELISRKTPDTDVIPREVLAFMRKHRCPAERVVFDRGGGGKQAADRLRAQGYNVRTVAFGEPVRPQPKRGIKPDSKRLQEHEQRSECKNRRAQLYYDLRKKLDPTGPGFGIPVQYSELRAQLAPIPLLYDNEGRVMLLPKKGEKSLISLIGHSPDEADALTLAIHAMVPTTTFVATAY